MTYYTHAEIINNFWKPLCDAHPGVADYLTAEQLLGSGYTTHLGNPIWMFRIGNPNGGRILFDGCLHGWEDLGSWIAYWFADWLLNSGDAKAQQILSENYWIFIPVLNYDSTGRGNANYAICTKYGVDLNRNFVTNWTYIDDCGNTNNGIYGCVSGPPSIPHINYLEKETITMRAIMNYYRPTGTEKAVYVNTHYGGGPWTHYAGNHNTSFWVPTRARILQIWGSEGNSLYGCKYPYLGALGMGDFLLAGVGGSAPGGASGDAAYVYGYDAFTIETYGRAKPSHPGVPCADGVPCGYDDPTWTETQTKVAPVFRALWIAFSEAVGVPAPAPSCSTNGPYTAYTGDVIQLDGYAVGGTPPYTYYWAFGDGATSTEQNPAHQYNNTGTFDISFTVTDSTNQYATCYTSATISSQTPPNYDDSVSFTIEVNGPQYENFNDTSYEKNNTPPGSFTYSSNQIDATGMTRNSTAYIRKNIGGISNFIHSFEMRLNSVTGEGTRCGYGVAANTNDFTYQDMISQSRGIQVYLRGATIRLRCPPSAEVISTTLLPTVWYHITVQKTGSSVLVTIEDTISGATQTLTTTSSTNSFSHIFPLMNFGNTTSDPTSVLSVNIANLSIV